MKERPEVLCEYRVKIIPSGEVGTRTRFGDVSHQIQPGGPSTMVCSACRKKMHVVAKILSFKVDGKEMLE